jgi:hypothetical protein
MGGPVPWYGTLLGGVILGLLILVVYVGFVCCCSKNSTSSLTRGNGDDIEYMFSFLVPNIRLTVYLVMIAPGFV